MACGDQRLRVDLAYPEERVALECDGYSFQSSRPAFERDRERWRLLRQAGWQVIWATWARAHEQQLDLVREVRAALAGRR